MQEWGCSFMTAARWAIICNEELEEAEVATEDRPVEGAGDCCSSVGESAVWGDEPFETWGEESAEAARGAG